MDVEHDILEVPVVADKTVPVFPHPKVLFVRDAEIQLVVLGQGPTRGDGLPTLDNPGKWHVGLHEHMHMIWHDAPCEEEVALAVEVLERMAHLLGQFRVLQGATTHAGIQPVFDFLAAPSGALAFGKLQQFRFQASEFFLRQTVGEAEGDGLEEFFRIAMGQVSTEIPFFGSADVLVGFFGLICIHAIAGPTGTSARLR